MSAINTAAIASPAAGPRALRLPARSRDSQDVDENPSVRYVQPVAASSHPPISTFDSMYNTMRTGGLVGGMPYDPYPPAQAFHTQGYDNRHMSSFPLNYRPPGQSAATIPSQHSTAIGYAPSSLHHTSSFNSQSEINHGGHHDRYVAGDWAQTFQGLSLGR